MSGFKVVSDALKDYVEKQAAVAAIDDEDEEEEKPRKKVCCFNHFNTISTSDDLQAIKRCFLANFYLGFIETIIFYKLVYYTYEAWKIRRHIFLLE